jgi:hypothetical protein
MFEVLFLIRATIQKCLSYFGNTVSERLLTYRRELINENLAIFNVRGKWFGLDRFKFTHRCSFI